MNEKNFKKQQEYLTNLNHQYTLVCDKIGIATNITFTTPVELEEYFENKANPGVVSKVATAINVLNYV